MKGKTHRRHFSHVSTVSTAIPPSQQITNRCNSLCGLMCLERRGQIQRSSPPVNRERECVSGESPVIISSAHIPVSRVALPTDYSTIKPTSQPICLGIEKYSLGEPVRPGRQQRGQRNLINKKKKQRITEKYTGKAKEKQLP